MSDGEFAYNHFTLDELRSLAASPQVGTMQAMPQSFRALADRVGEVADLLTHAQADLPNWWKGPAADQAAATLGRAAAEAREFHDSAMGAATAVSRCAQVVAEQQHQMMNVPDMPEPGVTDAVQRPATPLEALEAARQDARYQAAHEQAVQVVNGIAAQYVETRAHLSTISIPGGENFASPPTPPINPIKTQISSPEPEVSSMVNDIHHGEPQPQGAHAISIKAQGSIVNDGAAPARARQGYRPQINSKIVHEEETTRPSNPETTNPKEDAVRFITEPAGLPAAPATAHWIAPSTDIQLASASTILFTPTEGSVNKSTPDELYKSENSTSAQTTHESPNRVHHVEISRENASRRFNARQVPARGSEIDVLAPLSNGRPVAQTSPEPAGHPQLDSVAADADNANATIIPPYSSIGSVRRRGEERNPRPDYLKERKSAWLPDTVAAPADGVITPEWFKRP